MPIFVFVVCGSEKFINTLNYSVSCLRKFSENKVIVVTDLSRNEAYIKHDTIVDIETPKKLTNHEASIYLKTSLHRILDLNDVYCYLDSDVIALSKEVDEIFNYQYGPITFASDHCNIEMFSPYAMNCGCLTNSIEKKEKLQELIKSYDPVFDKEEMTHNMVARELYRTIGKVIKRPWSDVHSLIRLFYVLFMLPKKSSNFRFNDNIIYKKSKHLWTDNDGNPILYNVLNYYKKIEKNSKFRFNLFQTSWLDENKKNISTPKCDHLISGIKENFEITISKNNWTHWNGGVFIFHKESIDFMETWHEFTMRIFSDKSWTVRDQGTLAATTWKFGLQNHQRLPEEYNFLADFYNPNITYNPKFGFTFDNFNSTIKPKFIHIYHEFGNKNWEVWQGVEKRTEIGVGNLN